MLSLILKKSCKSIFFTTFRSATTITTTKAIADKKKQVYQNKVQETAKHSGSDKMLGDKVVDKR